MSFTLLYTPNTRAGRVRWLLEELAVPYELKRVESAPGQPRSAEHLEIHPLGKVPALVVDGQPMIESGAMLVYLADRYFDRGLAPAVDAPERCAYLQWIFFVVTTLEPPLVDMFFKGGDDAIKARGLADFDAAAQVVAAKLADGRPFLLGTEFSTADIALGSILGWARVLGVLANHPVLIEYGRRVGARPAAKAARAD